MEEARGNEGNEFLRPRLVGARFEGHSIPLEVLRDLAVLEPMIIDVARWKYLQAHGERKRVPKGFARGVTLKLTGIGQGSAVPWIDLDQAAPVQLHLEHRSYFEDARDSVIEAIHLAGRDESVDGVLPNHLLTYFDKLGRRLREGEAIEFPSVRGRPPATFNRRVRRRLVLAASGVDELSDEVLIRGTVYSADHTAETFGLLLPDGRKVKGPLVGPHKTVILEAHQNFDSGMRIEIGGIGIFNRSSTLQSIESIDYAIGLDPLDVDARIEELRAIRPGWLNGHGAALSQLGLDWLSAAFNANYPVDAPPPFLYPTETGNVRAEWTRGSIEISIDIDLSQKTGAFHSIDLRSDEEVSRDLNLGAREGWRALAQLVDSASANLQ